MDVIYPITLIFSKRRQLRTPHGPPGSIGLGASSWEMATAPALGTEHTSLQTASQRVQRLCSQGIQRKPLAKFFMTFSFIYNRDAVFPGEE